MLQEKYQRYHLKRKGVNKKILLVAISAAIPTFLKEKQVGQDIDLL